MIMAVVAIPQKEKRTRVTDLLQLPVTLRDHQVPYANIA